MRGDLVWGDSKQQQQFNSTASVHSPSNPPATTPSCPDRNQSVKYYIQNVTLLQPHIHADLAPMAPRPRLRNNRHDCHVRGQLVRRPAHGQENKPDRLGDCRPATCGERESMYLHTPLGSLTVELTLLLHHSTSPVYSRARLS